MHLLDKLRSSNGWRIAFALKVIVLVALWVSFDKGIMIGDRPAAAKDEPTAATPAAEDATKAAATVAGATPEGGAKDAPADKAPEAVQPKTRKSFLANLLELPTIDPGSVEKEELSKYVEIAERKRHQVEERLEMLKHHEERLKVLESSIDDKLHSLQEERGYLAQTIQEEKNRKTERLDRLIATYAKMEPKKAAPVFEKMDKDLVVELFKALPQKQVTAILETMSPDKSVQLTEYYGRVRSMREYDMLKEINQDLTARFADCRGMATSTAPAGKASATSSDAPGAAAASSPASIPQAP